MRHSLARPAPLAALVVALALGACAHGIPDVDPADLPRLRQEVDRNPTDTDLRVQLGMAQFKSGDHEAALTTLQGAVDEGNESGPALLYLGLTHEELEQWSEAREAYSRYLEVGRSGPVMDEVEERLGLIGRQILRAQAREALAREDEIAATEAPTPRSVAVFPFAFNSDREDLEPLIYALSDMMVTDFAVSNALVVLERTQVQTLLDEMALTEAGYAEPGTGARAGRMLRAEHVVQGVLTTLSGDGLQTEADILNVPSTSTIGGISESGTLERLFDLEKEIVIRTIRDVLRVDLTPAEEQAILDNRVDNVLAFLAYGRGLREMDRGNYAEALTHFGQAQQLGGDNARIDAVAGEAQSLAGASDASTGDLAELAGGTGELGGSGIFGSPTDETIGRTATVGSGDTGAPLGGTLANLTEGVAPTPTASTLDQGSSDQIREQPKQTNDTTREPVPETTGGELPTSGQATITIVIPRPGA